MWCEHFHNQSSGFETLEYGRQDVLSDVEMDFPIQWTYNHGPLICQISQLGRICVSDFINVSPSELWHHGFTTYLLYGDPQYNHFVNTVLNQSWSVGLALLRVFLCLNMFFFLRYTIDQVLQ